MVVQEFTALSVNMSDWDAFISCDSCCSSTHSSYFHRAFGVSQRFRFWTNGESWTRDCQAGIDTGVNSDSLNPFSHKNARPLLFGAPLLVMLVVLCAVLVPQGFPFKGRRFIVQSGFIIGLFLCRDYLDLANGLLRCKLSDGVSSVF